jgi:hypothetical protein
MRVLAATIICLALAVSASATIFVNVYHCDGVTPLLPKDPNTPYVYSDIMVGTHLILIVSSDEPAPLYKWWWGALLTSMEDWDRGKLAGRDSEPNDKRPYDGSCLEAAGWCPRVTFGEYPDFDRIGFDLMADCDPVAGNWFVFDYYAEEVGVCSVQLFDRGYGPDEGVPPEVGGDLLDRGEHPDVPIDFNVPDETLSFAHVPSCDLNGDHIVDFRDFVLLTCHWRQTTGTDPAAPALPDLDADSVIGPSDIARFSDFWLERTDCGEPAAEP